MITPQGLLLGTWIASTIIPWPLQIICGPDYTTTPWPEFIGRQIGRAINRATISIILHWGGVLVKCALSGEQQWS